MAQNDGTIDITDVVEKARSTFVLMGVTYLKGVILAIPGLQWLGLPIIRNFFDYAITKILNMISNWGVMSAFFMNTAIRKASQAHDFVDAVNQKNALPEDASDEEYEKLELAQISAFNNFIRITN